MGSGGSRLKLDRETLDGAGNTQNILSWAFQKLRIYEPATEILSPSCVLQPITKSFTYFRLRRVVSD